MKTFSDVLKSLARQIRSLQTTELTPTSTEAHPPNSTRSLYQGESVGWGVDVEQSLRERLDRNAPQTRLHSRALDRIGSSRRRPRRSLRHRLAASPTPSPRGLLNGGR